MRLPPISTGLETALQPVFHGDRLHVGVVGAHVRAGQVGVAVAVKQAGETADDLGMLGRAEGAVGGDDAGLAAAEGQVCRGVLQGHAPRQVEDGEGGDVGQHANPAHRRPPHGQVVHHQVSPRFDPAFLVPHADDQPRPQPVNSDAQPMQAFQVADRTD
jgi:hypothetical protein